MLSICGVANGRIWKPQFSRDDWHWTFGVRLLVFLMTVFASLHTDRIAERPNSIRSHHVSVTRLEAFPAAVSGTIAVTAGKG